MELVTIDFNGIKPNKKKFIKWVETNVGMTVGMINDNWASFEKVGSLIPDSTGKYKSDEERLITEYYQSLDQATEDAANLVPSNLEGQLLANWKDKKKTELLSVDWSTLNIAQKKIILNLELTDTEKDSLGV